MNNSRQYAEQLAQWFEKQPQGAVRKKFAEMAEEFSVVNFDESRALADKYRCKIRQCFANCFEVAKKDKRYTYVEGYCTSLIPLDHAWLLNEKGEVVDPTYILTDSKTTDYFGVRVPVKKINHKLFEPGWLTIVLEAIANEKPKKANRRGCV